MNEYQYVPLGNNVTEMFIGPFGSSLKNECFVSRDKAFCMVYEQRHAIQKTMDIETRYVDEQKYNELKRFNVQSGDIIVSCRGTIGETFIVPKNAPLGIMHPSIMKIRLKDGVYDKYYFNLLLKTRLNKHKAEANGSGVKMAISATELSKEIFPVPTMTEQLEITSIISKTYDIIEKRKKELQSLDILTKARFVEMFGDPVLNEKGWVTRPFLDMGSCKNGMNFHYEDSGVELNCLGVGDFKDYSVITNTELLPTVSLNEMPSEEYLLRDDDIVFVRSNGNKALVGRSVAVYSGDTPTTFSGFCIRYRKHDDDITIPYLLRALKTDSIRMKMAGRGANIQNLNQQILGTLIIPVPPLDLQNQFAEFIKQVDKSKVAVQKALDETQVLFDSLMQKYFG